LITIAIALAAAAPALAASFTFGGNDNLAAAAPVIHFPSSPFFWTGSTIGYTNEAGELLPCAGISNTAWFTFPGVAGPAVVDTFGSNYDTVLAAYSGPVGATSTGQLTLLACNDDFNGLQSQVTFPVAAGTQYYLQVGGFFGGQGNVKLSPH
jgi:hypothetical protein